MDGIAFRWMGQRRAEASASATDRSPCSRLAAGMARAEAERMRHFLMMLIVESSPTLIIEDERPVEPRSRAGATV